VKSKPVILRAMASRDIDEAIAHHLEQSADSAALGFIDARGQACLRISRHAATGSPRYAPELNLPGLRSWTLSRCPHLVFHRQTNDHIDVWRVLHGERDIPEWMQQADPP
jgi:toxin ParE1/3/4